jgi:hypothetical protein
MSENTAYLIDQLDRMHRGELNPELQERLRADKALAEEWNALQIAMATIQEAGLKERVEAISKEYRKTRVMPLRKSGAPVRIMYRYVFTAAATVILLIAISAIYKFSSVSSTGVFEKNFSAYELSTLRGNSQADELEKAYREKNWPEVLSQFTSLQNKNNKSYFLAGMAKLEAKDAAAAIPLFNQVLKNNASGVDPLFHDEAEYYLALSFLANNEASKAIPVLKRILGDKNHLYNRTVREMSWIDLRIIEIKSGK